MAKGIARDAAFDLLFDLLEGDHIVAGRGVAITHQDVPVREAWIMIDGVATIHFDHAAHTITITKAEDDA